MLIGELSMKTGFSKDTIRFYEKNGLLQVNRNERRENNYKEYSEEILHRLQLIRRMKKLGFTLNEVNDLLEMMKVNEASCKNVALRLDEKIKLLDEKMEELLQLRAILSHHISKCNALTFKTGLTDHSCPVLEID